VPEGRRGSSKIVGIIQRRTHPRKFQKYKKKNKGVHNVEPLLGIEKISVYVDGTLTNPQLDHPEGLAFDQDGTLYCGGERGQLYRIDPERRSIEEFASTDGFILGVALDGRGSLYACDLKHAAVFRVGLADGSVQRFASGMKAPNFPVVDVKRNALYVSDSRGADEPGPRVWRIDLESGVSEVWFDAPLSFANGMALSPDGNWLYVVESFARRVVRIEILPDGRAGRRELAAEDVGRVPDGLAFDAAGNLYVSCYEPSGVYRISPEGSVALIAIDPEAHALCHPTNCAFYGSDLYTANLGRWHISKIELGALGLPLPAGDAQ